MSECVISVSGDHDISGGRDYCVHCGFKPKQAGVESALDVQEGGEHYKGMKIQPIEFIHANGLGFAEGSVIKYVSRHRAKNGLEDLKKARHFLDLLIELEYGERASER